MPWKFVQANGALIAPAGGILTYGYSGALGFVNQPEYQAVKDKGPLPAGWYTIIAPVDSPKHGPFALRLIPDPENDMFGRDNFFIHGDSVSHPGAASEGCIIAPRFARERVWESGDRRLEVVKELAISA